MTTTTLALAIALCTAVGIALGLAVQRVRLGREVKTLQRDWNTLYRRHQAEHDRMVQQHEEWRAYAAALAEQVTAMGPPLIDARNRWGFELPQDIAALVDDWTPEDVSEWLMRHAPGIDKLSDGLLLRPSPRWFAPLPAAEESRAEVLEPDFDGWRPPAVVRGALRLGEGQG